MIQKTQKNTKRKSAKTTITNNDADDDNDPLMMTSTVKNSSTPSQPPPPIDDIKDPEVYKRRLHAELIHRDSEQNISARTNPLTLAFRDLPLEQKYRDSHDITSCVSLLGLPLTLFAVMLAYFFVGPMYFLFGFWFYFNL